MILGNIHPVTFLAAMGLAYVTGRYLLFLGYREWIDRRDLVITSGAALVLIGCFVFVLWYVKAGGV